MGYFIARLHQFESDWVFLGISVNRLFFFSLCTVNLWHIFD
ncbi:hypothetical protein GPLA_4545 [Paraglaciecola polaris LMG 21857]|uniref:Uncharacterized protein n=1 Tax=Paraglaciecola polaris LMG 21857 TaxID=1129793 RepID=K7AJJ9_9ALTE|nr:hypothetical protein GPLA_4545 [Paraglaciecola polaris LMG 21857]